MRRRDIVEFLLGQGEKLDISAACVLGLADQVTAFLDADPDSAQQGEQAGAQQAPTVLRRGSARSAGAAESARGEVAKGSPMIVIASANGSVGMEAAMDVLRAGGSALDAVEAGRRSWRLNADDHSVGVGGYPNVLGEVELDASIMEGTTRRAGAVAALRDYPHPISVARADLGAPAAAPAAGRRRRGPVRRRARLCRRCTLLTPEAEDAWRRTMAGEAPGRCREPRLPGAALAQDPERTVGTVNFIAQDAQGRIASAVSTSGWAFKYPGRVGDSPLIGAGNYCDDRYGACACTGLGEWAIRAGTARMVVPGLQSGLSLADACERAMRDLADIPLPPDIEPVMNLIALDQDGRHAAYTTAEGRAYVWQTPDMEHHRTEPRVRVAG